MSWFFKSLQSDDPESSGNRGGGVKDDFTVISDTIGRQLRGVANFLAPPPPRSSSQPSTEHNNNNDDDGDGDDDVKKSEDSEIGQVVVGIRNDLAEIGGTLRTGLSKFTYNFLQFHQQQQQEEDDYQDDDDDVAGITNEVIDFVNEISLRPEYWTDFPLSLQNDFEMSDAQREHASAVEHYVPSLISLRTKLHTYMGDHQFWFIYFILLLPRLNPHHLPSLSTPQIVETRNILLQKLQNKRNAEAETSENSVTVDTSQESSEVGKEQEGNITSWEKEVTEIVNATGRLEIDDEENADQWLKDTQTETDTTLDGRKRLEHEEDVSFSDLEDDDNDLSIRVSGSRKAQEITRVPSPSGSSDWVQLNESLETQGGLQKARQSISREKDSDAESNDWLKVDDFD